LEAVAGFRAREAGFELGGDGFEGVGVEVGFEVVGDFFDVEEAIVEADFGAEGVCGGDPMDGAFYFAAGLGLARAGFGIEGAAEFNDLAGGVFDDFVALNDADVAKADFAAGGEAEVFFGRIFHEVVALDVEGAGEGNFAGASGRVFGVVDGFDLFDVVFVHVGQDDFDGAQDGHDAWGDFVEVFAEAEFEEADVGEAVEFGDADAFAEGADGFGGVAAAAVSGNGGHAGVVPAGNEFFFDELEEFALAHDGVAEVEAREFDLLRVAGCLEGIQKPIVEGAMDFEFEGADGMGDAFDHVGERVGVIVHGIDAPRVAGAMVGDFADAIENGIAQVDVGRGHVDFGAQDALAFGEFARAHAAEEVEVFGDGAMAERAFFAGDGGGAAIFLDVVEGEIADERFAFFDELLGEIVEPLIIIGREEFLVAPVEAEPADVFLDGIDVLDVFARGIGVVEAQMADAAALLVFEGDAEVEADGFGVADVEVAVGFGGKAGDHAAAVFAGAIVVGNHVANKIAGRRRGRGSGGVVRRRRHFVAKR